MPSMRAGITCMVVRQSRKELRSDMKLELDGFVGQVKRCVGERKFNLKDERCCRTGGRSNGCPFFRLSRTQEWICTLYRFTPTFINQTKRYRRTDACLKNEEPPTKRHYLITYITRHTCDVMAVSSEEAHEIFIKNNIGIIETIEEGGEVEYENLI